jgi:hypothetical protein
MTTPVRRSSRFQAREAAAAGVTSYSVQTVKKRKRTASYAEDAEYTAQAEEPEIGEQAGLMPVKAAKKSRQAKPEPTLIIPDVSKKETTFKGRLGSFFLLGGSFFSY